MGGNDVVVVLGPSIENRGAQRSDSRRSLSGVRGAEPPASIRKRRVAGDDDVAENLQRLGARVCVGSLFAEIDEIVGDDTPQCVVVDGATRPDLAARSLRHARGFAATEIVPALVALPAESIQTFDPASGFADFIVLPSTPVELYARLRKLEWNRSEFATDERSKIGRIVVDRVLHEVTLDGRAVQLTAREFALLAFFAQNRDRMLRRDVLLARVWGARYEGGPRTVDIHVRRLRAKLGDALPLETLRGAGYLLRASR